MGFRPCIDIHDGAVKQIVGGSLNDDGASENFVSNQDAAFFGNFYKEKGIKGGHVILLNKPGTEEYELTYQQAMLALKAYPNGLQIGGGITADNAGEFINAGASHVIVTSYVFNNGHIDYDRLNALVDAVGKSRLVLDLSCRKKGNEYYIVTDRWQVFTEEIVSKELLIRLESYCDEYLIHAVDVEGKKSGVDKELITILSEYLDEGVCPVTYAGGVHSFDDLNIIRDVSGGRLNYTIGSALDLFGGHMNFQDILNYEQ